MIIKKIKLKNFKCFDNAEFDFSKINLIQGQNGSGKSSLALESVLFCLYGYNENSLRDLIQKGKKSCTVAIQIIKNKNLYNIVRTYPTSLKISINNEWQKLSSNTEGQSLINNVFGDRQLFQKFRLIDNSAGINILEQGKTSLRKTLLSVNEDFLNNIRTNLNNKKSHRQQYNKDNNPGLFTHYPSQTRLSLLNARISDIEPEIRGLYNNFNESNREIRALHSDKGKLENSKSYYKSQRDKVYQNNACPTCDRKLNEEKKNMLLKDYNQRILSINSKLENLQNNILEESEVLEHIRISKDNLEKRRNKLNTLVTKLKSRIKAKAYKYTSKDVLIIKKAIEELDKFHSYFIREWLSSLLPILNSVTEKIGFTVDFIITDKGAFDIELEKDGQKFTYKNLSEGQKLIVSIAFKLAILMEKGESGLITADEGFSSLDQTNLNYVFELFNNFPYQLTCVIHRLEETPKEINKIEL